MSNPIISVIVPIYNSSTFLEECVDSIISQSYKQLEIILVDNGSTDNCPQICDKYAEVDSRIKVIHKIHGSISSARNEGLATATGEFISFVDSDDVLLSDAFECLVNGFSDESVGIVVGKATRLYIDKLEEKTDSEQIDEYTSSQAIFAWLCKNQFGSEVWGKLYRHSCVKGIVFPEKRCEDMCYLFDAINNSEKTVVVDKNKYLYRMHRLYSERTAYRRPVEDEKVEVWEQFFGVVKEKYPEIYDEFYAAGCKSILSSVLRIYAANKVKPQKVYLENSSVFFKNTGKAALKSSRIDKKTKILIFLFSRLRFAFDFIFKLRNIIKN